MEQVCENCKYYSASKEECPCEQCFHFNEFIPNESGIDFMVEIHED